MSQSKFKAFAVLSVCSALVFASACSKAPQGASGNPSGGSASGGPEPKTLKIAPDAWMVEKLQLNTAVAKFKEKHPDVNVVLQPYPDKTVLANFALQWSQNKTDADIVMVDGSQEAVQYMAKDLLLDFNKTDFFTGATAKDKFVGTALKFGDVNGFQFAIPFSLETYAINVNKKMFQEAGLTDAQGNVIQPKNWDEIYQYAKKLTKKDGNKVTQQGMTIQWGPNAQSTLIAVEQAARGSFYKDNSNVLTFDTPEMRNILSIWKKGADEGVFSIDTFTNKDAGRNNFDAGQVAMLLQSGSTAAEAEPTIGKGNSTVIPIPGSDKNGSYAFTAGIIVPKATKAPKLAVQFIQEALMDSQVQNDGATKWGKLPVINDYFDKINAEWKTNLYTIIQKSVTAPFYRDYPVLDKNMPVELQNYLTGKEDLDTFIKNAEKMIDGINKNVK
ncbi:extracellular solute-binding protein [Paenibacillus filicis]|uniref:Extracellular solute-binding protein n=1 Tax=Paenibacillus gyeongsangnamensis TaxID=3388067 RepID=A0ABT4Q5U2_9BACL|nr:extracellular solute-binding protein [Paenibacillus filicis]MCZ8512166.1 extracellular solute-binding protein [Paenibacillus filicis]